jgi:hypothetical protein
LEKLRQLRHRPRILHQPADTRIAGARLAAGEAVESNVDLKRRWPEIDHRRPPPHVPAMKSDTEEPIRRKVGGSLTRLPALQRLEVLRRNAVFLRGGKWTPPSDDGTHIRKTVGSAR